MSTNSEPYGDIMHVHLTPDPRNAKWHSTIDYLDKGLETGHVSYTFYGNNRRLCAVNIIIF